MRVKEKKAIIAARNSRENMKDMYEFSANGRVYQTEKKMPSSWSRYTRIRSPEEIKRADDESCTVNNIRRVEKYLGGTGLPENEITSKYHLMQDEDCDRLHGDSETVFQILCSLYPQARYYTSWSDLLLCAKDGKPLRTEPMKSYHVEPEKTGLPVPAYHKGDVVWTIIERDVVSLVKCPACSGRGWYAYMNGAKPCWKCSGNKEVYEKTDTEPAAAEAIVVSWYTKKLRENRFGIIYELTSKEGAFGKDPNTGMPLSIWRLEDGGRLFNNKEDAVRAVQNALDHTKPKEVEQ